MWTSEESLLIDKVIDISPLCDSDILRIKDALSILFSPENIEKLWTIINLYSCKHRVILAEILDEMFEIKLYYNGLDRKYLPSEESMLKRYKAKFGFNV